MRLRPNWAASAVLALWFSLNLAGALKFIVVPMPSDNSPVLDLMAVAAQLQSRWAQQLLLAAVGSTVHCTGTACSIKAQSAC